MKTGRFKTYSITYLLFSICFGVYWGTHFLNFVDQKGDDFFVNAEIMTGITYIFCLLFYFFVNKRVLAILLILPPVLAISSFVIGFFGAIPLSYVWSYLDTEAGDHLIYCLVYSVSAIWLLYTIKKAFPEATTESS
jgi:hypothetical protein